MPAPTPTTATARKGSWVASRRSTESRPPVPRENAPISSSWSKLRTPIRLFVSSTIAKSQSARKIGGSEKKVPGRRPTIFSRLGTHKASPVRPAAKIAPAVIVSNPGGYTPAGTAPESRAAPSNAPDPSTSSETKRRVTHSEISAPRLFLAHCASRARAPTNSVSATEARGFGIGAEEGSTQEKPGRALSCAAWLPHLGQEGGRAQ